MMNRAGLNMIEADSLDQVKGLCAYSMVAEEHREAFKAMVEGVFKGEGRALEFKAIGLKGRPIWLYSHGVPLRDGKGEIISMLSATMDITERKAAEEERNRSLMEKEVLLREIHHRVKNNLAIISSLLSLQSMRTKDSEASDMLRESRGRIMSMALVHEKLYRSTNLARIDFKDYARELAAELLKSYNAGGVGLHVEGEGVFMEIDALIPSGLILNELITNSIKHAFSGVGNPEIKINLFKESDKEIRLVVSDNGCGLPKEKDFGESKSLGFQIVATLVKQLKGSLDIELKNGTEFIIHIPMPSRETAEGDDR